jgi:hypothetical protein
VRFELVFPQPGIFTESIKHNSQGGILEEISCYNGGMPRAETQINVGEYDVISSGQFIGISSAKNSIEITQGTNKIVFHLLFKNDESSQPKLESRTLSDTELEITFVNFDNSIGLGNTSLIKLGTFGGRELFFSYRIFVLNDKTLRTIDYTFYAK